ncbi:MAG TPA: FIST N-terminal domain-containing protein [Acidimicrobiia bacterium]|jgi:small ligand-binding sensory domain FIST|nr:FIST N-terminal domain-containing protein [Acidimicrobiia bacterium]
MTRFASALSQHPIAANAVGEAAGEILERLDGEGCDLAVCFASTHHVGAFEDIGPALRNILEPRVLVGGTAVAVAGGPHEIEENPALTVFAARLDAATLTPVTLRVQETPDGAALTGWPSLDRSPGSLLLFADPFTFPVDAFLQRVNRDLPGLQIIGGLASAAGSPGGNRLVLDERVVDEGAVGVFVDGGGIEVRTLVSQGCRPIGRPYVVTRGEQNLIEELGGKPAIERLQELAGAASEEERELLRRGLHVGLVVDEHKAEFGRGDFLVRNLLGADESSGALAVGEQVSVGQTVQFHVRDAGAADEDLREMLNGVDAEAALLFTCNGRGRHLFTVPDHDAGMVENLLGPIPLAGAFCAGEIGPVGGRNFLHGFTASLALFA